MSDRVSFTSVEFRNFKAFERFSVTLQDMNVLVGPNNSGKSTVIGAFRVLAAALRRARVDHMGGCRNECSEFELRPGKWRLWSLDVRHPLKERASPADLHTSWRRPKLRCRPSICELSRHCLLDKCAQ
ncbi:MAG: AAA family ATPase [Candidatus Binatia bacterium]